MPTPPFDNEEPSAPAAPEAAAPVADGRDQHRAEPTHPGVPLAPPGIVPESDVRVHSPAAAAPQPAHGLVEELGELPYAYGDSRLVALVRDPATLYLYWDFSQQQVEQAFTGLGASRAVVRLWNTRGGGGGDLLREEEVHLPVRGWYLRELPPGTELRAELWAVGERGQRMMRAARPVKLPPAVPSDRTEALYVRLPLGEPLPRDGVTLGRRGVNYGGAQPQGWDRRVLPRGFDGSSWSSGAGGPGGPSSPGARLPWSMTHLLPDLPGPDGES